MFRENVLIALTILITILSLSYVIVLTTYMQIHQMEERRKKYEKEYAAMDGVDSPAKTVYSRLGDADDSEKFSTRNNMNVYNATTKLDIDKLFKDVFLQEKLPHELSEIKFGETIVKITTESPNRQGVLTNDDLNIVLPQPPFASRSFPYNLYARNGHVILELPDSLDLVDDMVQVKKALNELNELHRMQQKRTRRYEVYDNMDNETIPQSVQRNQRGLIWIRISTTTPSLGGSGDVQDDSELEKQQLHTIGINMEKMKGRIRGKRSVDSGNPATNRKISNARRYRKRRNG